ncbi:hypothetical protein COLO4_16014 [Corchorus olitorius]|uniref:Uncharacterized protein n=1 Tax=Corchorus olitorius TaxID=93759 RepID=A0A1R3JKG3_9ROSI|nr:hypothetical protein COLO4_16014 [Corchorus olitorius]
MGFSKAKVEEIDDDDMGEGEAFWKASQFPWGNLGIQREFRNLQGIQILKTESFGQHHLIGFLEKADW